MFVPPVIGGDNDGAVHVVTSCDRTPIVSPALGGEHHDGVVRDATLLDRALFVSPAVGGEHHGVVHWSIIVLVLDVRD